MKQSEKWDNAVEMVCDLQERLDVADDLLEEVKACAQMVSGHVWSLETGQRSELDVNLVIGDAMEKYSLKMSDVVKKSEEVMKTLSALMSSK